MEDNRNPNQLSGKEYYREKYPHLYNNPTIKQKEPKTAEPKIIAKKVEKKSVQSIKKNIKGQFDDLKSKTYFKNIKDKEHKKKLLKVLLLYLAGLYVLFLLLNNLVIPAIVHSRALVTVPKVIGLKAQYAKQNLENDDLEWEIVAEVSNEEIKPGYVIKQDPKPGTEVKSGRPVYLVISKGREATEVPNLKGLSLRNVEIRLMNYGLKLGRVDSVYNSDFPRGVIIKQWPYPGDKSNEKGIVNIVVSLGSSSKVMVPKLIGFSLDGIYQFIEENGLKLGNVVYEKNDTYQANVIIYQSPAAGDSVQRGSTINITVAQ